MEDCTYWEEIEAPDMSYAVQYWDKGDSWTAWIQGSVRGFFITHAPTEDGIRKEVDEIIKEYGGKDDTPTADELRDWFNLGEEN